MIVGIFNSLRKTDRESKKIGLEGSSGGHLVPPSTLKQDQQYLNLF